MNILFSVNQNYLDKAKSMLFSLAQHTHEINNIYLLNNELSVTQINKLQRFLKKRCNSNLIVISPDKLLFSDMPLQGWFSIEIYYRILAQTLLPQSVDRVLWLDADIIIMDDISDFYYQDFDGSLIVATPDVNYNEPWFKQTYDDLKIPYDHKYFNSGVILFNIDEIRKSISDDYVFDVCQKLKDVLKYPDQDILNYLYQGKTKFCDDFSYNYQLTNKLSIIDKEQLKNLKILHYSGYEKPWMFGYINETSKYYWRVQLKIGNLFGFVSTYFKYFLRKVYKKIKS